MNKYSVIIVGGGTSGLISYIELTRGKNALKKGDVLLIEKNDRVGKKLLATGNGQGNLSNENISVDNYYGNGEFVKQVVKGIKSFDLEEYFNCLGIPLCKDETGRIYPMSKQASAVLDVFRAHLKDADILFGSTVTDIVYENNSYCVLVGKDKYYADNVILAVGGSAGKQFGTDGSSYKLATKFGHKLTDITPSLVQLKTELEPIKGLKGLKETARVIALDGDKVLKQAVGDILFTEYGISGSAVFQISGHLLRAKDPVLKIEFLPYLDYEESVKVISLCKENSPLFNENPFCGIINKMIGKAIIKRAKGNSVESLAYAVKNFSLKVLGSLGFNYSQVTKGGIDCKDIDAECFESKLKKGLYLCGEYIDIDGDCGGYNLTFAFYSGITVARKIKENIGGSK